MVFCYSSLDGQRYQLIHTHPRLQLLALPQGDFLELPHLPQALTTLPSPLLALTYADLYSWDTN